MKCWSAASKWPKLSARTACAASISGDWTIKFHIALRSTKKLLDAATKAGKQGITLLLENDAGLNTATGAEAAKVLSAVQSPFFMLNWDPGNAGGGAARNLIRRLQPAA